MNLSFERRHSAGMRLTPMGGGGGGGSTQAENMTAMMNVQMSREQLDWAKEIYAETAPDRAAASDLSKQVAVAQMDQMRSQTQMADDAYADYKRNYQPLEQDLINEARAYDTEDRREAEAGRATADVTQQFNIAGEAAIRDMQRAGVNPSDGKMLGARQSLVAQEALARAGAANNARSQVETVGAAKRADAVNLGRGIASSQGTNAAMALQQGNSASGNMAAALAAQNSGNANMQAAYGGARQGLGAAGNAFGNIAARQGAADAAQQGNMAAGIGAVGTIAAVAI